MRSYNVWAVIILTSRNVQNLQIHVSHLSCNGYQSEDQLVTTKLFLFVRFTNERYDSLSEARI